MCRSPALEVHRRPNLPAPDSPRRASVPPRSNACRMCPAISIWSALATELGVRSMLRMSASAAHSVCAPRGQALVLETWHRLTWNLGPVTGCNQWGRAGAGSLLRHCAVVVMLHVASHRVGAMVGQLGVEPLMQCSHKLRIRSAVPQFGPSVDIPVFDGHLPRPGSLEVCQSGHFGAMDRVKNAEPDCGCSIGLTRIP